MRDPTGHYGFSSFDDALVLWGCGDPGASCRDKRKREKAMREMEGKRKLPVNHSSWEKQYVERKHWRNFWGKSFQCKWHATVLCFVPWWLQVAQRFCFCMWRNWEFLSYYTAQPCFPNLCWTHTPLNKTLFTVHVCFWMNVRSLVCLQQSHLCVFHRILKKRPCMCSSCALTPNHEVGRCLVDAPGVARHASVGPSVWDVGGGDKQAAWLEQGEPGQLNWTTGQHALTWRKGDGWARRQMNRKDDRMEGRGKEQMKHSWIKNKRGKQILRKNKDGVSLISYWDANMENPVQTKSWQRNPIRLYLLSHGKLLSHVYR